MKLQAVLIALGGVVLSVACAVVMWVWPLSPYHRIAAYITVRTNTASSVPELISAAQTAVGNPNASVKELAAVLPSYGVLATTEVLHQIITQVPFEKIDETDATFLEGATYTNPVGSDGARTITTMQVAIGGTVIGTFDEQGDLTVTPVTQVTFTGTKLQTDLTTELTNSWKQLVTLSNKKDTTGLTPLLNADDIATLPNYFKLSDLAYRLQAKATVTLKAAEETPTSIVVGSVTLTQSGCLVKGIVPILYLKDSHTYVFDNVYAILASMCAKPRPANPKSISTLSCSNCWLAPVSKSYRLSSGYAPYVVATGLAGGGAVTPDTKTALTKLFNAAKAAGMTPRVSSSYRSYKIQTELFNSYVANEKAKGLSTAKAIEKANTYSAKPGHSEHQLGTTVDLMACPAPCSFYDPKNLAFFNFLGKNAHKYGFIVSYPSGSQAYTGYIYEPWHIRYIGVTKAKELYNKGYLTKKGFYLYHFLLQNGMY